VLVWEARNLIYKLHKINCNNFVEYVVIGNAGGNTVNNILNTKIFMLLGIA
jgi:hypothetical protein